MSTSPKERFRARAAARSQAEPGLTWTLGCIMLVGMEELAFHERVAGGELQNTYHTHFTLDDGEWELELRKKDTACKS